MTATKMVLADAAAMLNSRTIETRPFINGSYAPSEADHRLVKSSPIDGRHLPPLSDCTVNDLDRAVKHAEAAFISGIWANRSRAEKKATMFRLADLIEQNASELAYLDSLETGRSFANFIEDSIPKAIQALRWFAEGVDKHDDRSGNPSPVELSLVSREPLGVVGLITLWWPASGPTIASQAHGFPAI